MPPGKFFYFGLQNQIEHQLLILILSIQLWKLQLISMDCPCQKVQVVSYIQFYVA